MSRVPSTLAALTAFFTLTAAPAHAAGCPSLTDPAGDGQWDIASVVSSGKLDVLSADVSSGPTTVVAVVRLASFAPDHVDRLGIAWLAGWTIDGGRYEVELRQSAVTGTSYVAEYSGPSGTGPVSYAIDATAATITWTIPRSALPVLATPGRVFSDLGAFSRVLSSSADNAFADGGFHTDGTTGCVSAA